VRWARPPKEEERGSRIGNLWGLSSGASGAWRIRNPFIKEVMKAGHWKKKNYFIGSTPTKYAWFGLPTRMNKEVVLPSLIPD
jgi:hypothetical protein